MNKKIEEIIDYLRFDFTDTIAYREHDNPEDTAIILLDMVKDAIEENFDD